MSESQKQLLKTMLFYELQNNLNINIDRLRLQGQDVSDLEVVKNYMESRINEINGVK